MAFLVGCGESADQKAAGEIRAKIDEAITHFDRAATLLGHTPVPSGEADAPVPPVDPGVAKALADAERVLSGVLSSAADASDAVKADAQQLLAEIRLTAGGYHSLLARDGVAKTNDLIRQAHRKMNRLNDLTLMVSFSQALASMDPAAAKQLVDETRAAREAAAAEVAELEGKVAALDKQIKEQTDAAELDRQAAAAIRMKLRLTGTGDKLALDTQASDLEAKYETAQADIVDLQLVKNNTAKELELVVARLANYKNRLAVAGDDVVALADRGETLAARGNELVAEAKTLADEVAASAGAVGEQFAETLKSFDMGAKSFKSARQANDSALRALKSVRSKAKELSAANSESAMKTVLDNQGGLGLQAAATARKGDIAKADADLAGQLLAAVMRAKAFAAEAKAACESVGVAVPQSLQDAIDSVEDLDTRAKQADESYGMAANAYGQVATQMLSGDARESKWMYQGFQARALAGRYRLTGNATYRNEAITLVTEALQGHEGDPTYAPLRQIASELRNRG